MEEINYLQEVGIEELPESLFHYTSITAILGIIENAELWASNSKFLNDVREMQEAIEYFKSEVASYNCFTSAEDEGRLLREALIEVLDDENLILNDVYVFSLSGCQDSLEQWRAYTPDSKGVALEFSAEGLCKLRDTQKLRIVKCFYKEAEKANLVKDFVKMIELSLHEKGSYGLQCNKMSAGDKKDAYKTFLKQEIVHLKYFLAMIKHECFENELEFRLVYIPNKDTEKLETFFRESSFSLTPFVKIKIDINKLFKSIYLGPNQNKLATDAFRLYVNEKDLNVEVFTSQLPFRSR